MVKQKDKRINRVFHALADSTRREILARVAIKECQASELASVFSISFPAVSKHLKVLEQSGLIKRDVQGRVHRFTLEAEALRQAHEWLDFYRQFWMGSLDNLDHYLKKNAKGGMK